MTAEVRRWWNCWLAHTWNRWSAPKEGINTLTGQDVMIQVRFCSACNRRQIRRAV